MIKLIFQIYRRRGLPRAAVNHAEKDREYNKENKQISSERNFVTKRRLLNSLQ